MREIKFRAWHKEQKKMYSAEGMAADQLTLLPTGKFINIHSEPSLSVVLNSMIPLQFTGLLDKNGKEVFEGDILCFTGLSERHRKPFVMSWNSKSAAWIGYSPKDQAEIIGNIYENPELVAP